MKITLLAPCECGHVAHDGKACNPDCECARYRPWPITIGVKQEGPVWKAASYDFNFEVFASDNRRLQFEICKMLDEKINELSESDRDKLFIKLGLSVGESKISPGHKHWDVPYQTKKF